MSEFDLRQTPHSLESEKCLLGSMMLDKEACKRCIHLVRPEDFFSDDHREIFNAICRLTDAGLHVDGRTVFENMKERGVAAECGGSAYLGEVLNSVPSALHATSYAETVTSRSLSRRMIQVVGEALHLLYELKPAGEVERRLLEGVAGLRGRAARDLDAKPLEELLHSAFDRLNSGGTVRLPSFSPCVQDILGGYGFGEMSVVAAWPSVGKSTWAKQEALQWALGGIPTGLLSLEETEQVIAEKYFAAHSPVPNHRIRKAEIGKHEWGGIGEAICKLAPAKLFVRDGLHTLDDVLAAANRLVAEQGVRAIVVDHMHRIAVPGGAKHNLNQHFTEVSGSLKAMFLRTNTAGLVAAQLTKDGMKDKRKPRAADCRESGSIFQDADVFMLLHREDRHHVGEFDYAPDNLCEVIVEKNRGGNCGQAVVGWDGPHQRFVDAGARPLPDGVF